MSVHQSSESTKTLSVVMPALNEEGNIVAAIDAAVRAIERHFDDYEVIVVNDGSTDNTLNLIEKEIRANSRIKVISHASPRGFGASYDSGRSAAVMKYCVKARPIRTNGK